MPTSVLNHVLLNKLYFVSSLRLWAVYSSGVCLCQLLRLSLTASLYRASSLCSECERKLIPSLKSLQSVFWMDVVTWFCHKLITASEGSERPFLGFQATKILAAVSLSSCSSILSIPVYRSYCARKENKVSKNAFICVACQYYAVTLTQTLTAQYLLVAQQITVQTVPFLKVWQSAVKKGQDRQTSLIPSSFHYQW